MATVKLCLLLHARLEESCLEDEAVKERVKGRRAQALDLDTKWSRWNQSAINSKVAGPARFPSVEIARRASTARTHMTAVSPQTGRAHDAFHEIIAEITAKRCYTKAGIMSPFDAQHSHFDFPLSIEVP